MRTRSHLCDCLTDRFTRHDDGCWGVCGVAGQQRKTKKTKRQKRKEKQKKTRKAVATACAQRRLPGLRGQNQNTGLHPAATPSASTPSADHGDAATRRRLQRSLSAASRPQPRSPSAAAGVICHRDELRAPHRRSCRHPLGVGSGWVGSGRGQCSATLAAWLVWLRLWSPLPQRHRSLQRVHCDWIRPLLCARATHAR